MIIPDDLAPFDRVAATVMPILLEVLSESAPSTIDLCGKPAKLKSVHHL